MTQTRRATTPVEDLAAASMRRTRLFLIGEIGELERAGEGYAQWVSQMRACVQRLESQLGGDVLPSGLAGPLRAVPQPA